jgi:hypothetical protein
LLANAAPGLNAGRFFCARDATLRRASGILRQARGMARALTKCSNLPLIASAAVVEHGRDDGAQRNFDHRSRNHKRHLDCQGSFTLQKWE